MPLGGPLAILLLLGGPRLPLLPREVGVLLLPLGGGPLPPLGVGGLPLGVGGRPLGVGGLPLGVGGLTSGPAVVDEGEKFGGGRPLLGGGPLPSPGGGGLPLGVGGLPLGLATEDEGAKFGGGLPPLATGLNCGGGRTMFPGPGGGARPARPTREGKGRAAAPRGPRGLKFGGARPDLGPRAPDGTATGNALGNALDNPVDGKALAGEPLGDPLDGRALIEFGNAGRGRGPVLRPRGPLGRLLGGPPTGGRPLGDDVALTPGLTQSLLTDGGLLIFGGGSDGVSLFSWASA